MSVTTAPAALRIAGDTNVGKVRTANEDSMIVDIARGLFVVLDGMGGANAGDVASQMARDAIAEFVDAPPRRRCRPARCSRRAIQAGVGGGVRARRRPTASATAWAPRSSRA